MFPYSKVMEAVKRQLFGLLFTKNIHKLVVINRDLAHVQFSLLHSSQTVTKGTQISSGELECH